VGQFEIRLRTVNRLILFLRRGKTPARSAKDANFTRIHQTLKTTPAVAAGVANHIWSIAEIVGLLDPSKQNLAELSIPN
jgi:hypothetical protein